MNSGREELTASRQKRLEYKKHEQELAPLQNINLGNNSPLSNTRPSLSILDIDWWERSATFGRSIVPPQTNIGQKFEHNLKEEK